MTNAILSLNNSVAKINAELQETKQMLLKSHNINSALIQGIENGIIRRIPKKSIDFRVALAEHCNLNCAGCDHFSPLAENKFADIEELKKDFSRLAELFFNKVSFIHLEGGEPLLHPEIIKILKMTREIFPNARINIVTNGLKLLSMPENFWQACQEYKIVIFPTKYPLSINYDAAEIKAKKYNIKFCYFNAGETIKTLFKLPLDPEGIQNENFSFFNCHRANNCIYLQNGRLYTCTVAPTVKHFDKHFGTQLFDAESNSIDIYKANSAEEILEFLANPIPFCRYCKIQNTVYNIQWHKSNRDINEWT